MSGFVFMGWCSRCHRLLVGPVFLEGIQCLLKVQHIDALSSPRFPILPRQRQMASPEVDGHCVEHFASMANRY